MASASASASASTSASFAVTSGNNSNSGNNNGSGNKRSIDGEIKSAKPPVPLRPPDEGYLELLERQNRRSYFPSAQQWANLLRAHDNAGRHLAAAMFGHTLDIPMYTELVARICESLEDPPTEGDKTVEFVAAETVADLLALAQTQPYEFQRREPVNDVKACSALRFLSLFAWERVDTDQLMARKLYEQLMANCQSTPELEKRITHEIMARRVPMGEDPSRVKEWIQRRADIDAVLKEAKELDEDQYVAVIYRFAQWYKQATHTDWLTHYYVTWQQLATTEFRERVLNDMINLKPRRPLVICAGRGGGVWLVHHRRPVPAPAAVAGVSSPVSGRDELGSVTMDEGIERKVAPPHLPPPPTSAPSSAVAVAAAPSRNPIETGCLYVCTDSVMALCVWCVLVHREFDGKDNFNKGIPVVL